MDVQWKGFTSDILKRPRRTTRGSVDAMARQIEYLIMLHGGRLHPCELTTPVGIDRFGALIVRLDPLVCFAFSRVDARMIKSLIIDFRTLATTDLGDLVALLERSSRLEYATIRCENTESFRQNFSQLLQAFAGSENLIYLDINCDSWRVRRNDGTVWNVTERNNISEAVRRLKFLRHVELGVALPRFLENAVIRGLAGKSSLETFVRRGDPYGPSPQLLLESLPNIKSIFYRNVSRLAPKPSDASLLKLVTTCRNSEEMQILFEACSRRLKNLKKLVIDLRAGRDDLQEFTWTNDYVRALSRMKNVYILLSPDHDGLPMEFLLRVPNLNISARRGDIVGLVRSHTNLHYLDLYRLREGLDDILDALALNGTVRRLILPNVDAVLPQLRRMLQSNRTLKDLVFQHSVQETITVSDLFATGSCTLEHLSLEIEGQTGGDEESQYDVSLLIRALETNSLLRTLCIKFDAWETALGWAEMYNTIARLEHLQSFELLNSGQGRVQLDFDALARSRQRNTSLTKFEIPIVWCGIIDRLTLARFSSLSTIFSRRNRALSSRNGPISRNLLPVVFEHWQPDLNSTYLVLRHFAPSLDLRGNRKRSR